MPRQRYRAILLALTLLLTGAGAAVADAPSAGLIRLAVATPGLLDLGALGAGHRLAIGVSLRHRDAAEEERAAGEVSNPRSPRYRRFWTPATWQARFGPGRGVAAGARTWLTRHGLAVAWSSYDYLLMTGTAGQVQHTFDVALRRFRGPTGDVFYAADRGPAVPASVGAVLGLDERERFHVASPGQDLCTGSQVGCVGALTPRDLWSIYDQPAGAVGHGQRVGVLGQGAWSGAVQDLRVFEQHQSLPRVNVRVVPVNDPNTDTANTVEWDIDTQATTGMAPGVDELVLYFAGSLAGSDMTAAMAAWANDPQGPNQVDASFGGCESANLALNVSSAEEPVFRQAAAEGRTLFVSTGDTGGSCTVVTGNGVVNTGAPQVEWPAASPHVTAVGGTQLYSDGAALDPHRTLEKAWEYTGGGSSAFEPAPDWQRRITVIAGRCAVGPDGNPPPPGTVCRGLPDVAAVSGDIATNGYAIVSNGHDSSGGGTSLSSPLVAGMWARIQATAPLVSDRPAGLGFAPPILYGRALAGGTGEAADFFDVTLGTNGQYTAIPANPVDPTGWDYVSGLGVPEVRNLMRHLTRSDRDTVTTAAPSQPDRVGTPTRLACRPDASLTDPSGDVFGAFSGDADATALHVAPVANGVLFTITIPLLADHQDDLLDDAGFSYGGQDYSVEGTKDPGLGYSYYLNRVVNGSSTILGTMQGTFDYGAHELRLTLDAPQFNALAQPKEPLGPGSVITIGPVLTSADIAAYDKVDSPGCPFRLR